MTIVSRTLRFAPVALAFCAGYAGVTMLAPSRNAPSSPANVRAWTDPVRAGSVPDRNPTAYRRTWTATAMPAD